VSGGFDEDGSVAGWLFAFVRIKTTVVNSRFTVSTRGAETGARVLGPHCACRHGVGGWPRPPG
jgi:hypothetical protein